GASYRAGLAARVPGDVRARVHTALAAGSGRLIRIATVAAAVLLLGVGVAFFAGGDSARHALAMPAAVIEAAEASRSPDPGPRGCLSENEGSPLAFPPVRDGALRIWACVERNGKTVAKLSRPEELPSVGYAAVPARGVEPGPTIGRTDLGDTVVYDIGYGSRMHYLAVKKVWLERQRQLTPGRESCRACHNLSRVGFENPHRIVERTWKLGAE
ncbi:MAG: hypothetical protein O2894_11935, partial [Planctomycetota bacterium]|nr:hypothetical protein [Planctomycetota bacterium]